MATTTTSLTLSHSVVPCHGSSTPSVVQQPTSLSTLSIPTFFGLKSVSSRASGYFIAFCNVFLQEHEETTFEMLNPMAMIIDYIIYINTPELTFYPRLNTFGAIYNTFPSASNDHQPP
ncbi:hypothetical protein QVD17_10128 [Tagetes erecta]|uniref:Uncharacterized protein n=1 Tax=Tagetes erecta TaxID=13708 RepID=A0AAD8P5N5_TARER|nr:hypothetical protein QVD17_10128 [Tagetes erecta]